MNRSMDLILAAREAGCDPRALALVARKTEGECASASLTAFTGAELDQAVDARVEALLRKGARAGGIFPVRLEADEDGVATLLALWRVGAVPAPLNPRLTQREEQQALAALSGRDAPAAQVVLWTSGTSGRPRGVALSYWAMTTHAEAVRRRLGLDARSDTWLASLPLAHVGGLMLVFRAILTGAKLLALGRVTAEETWGLIRGDLPATNACGPVTHASLVPTQLRRLLEASGPLAPPASFRCLLVGGAHTPPDLLERARRAGWPVAPTYGMTEMSSQIATAVPSTVHAKPGCVGAPLDGVEIHISETEEVYVRGPGMAAEYLDGESLADHEGWHHTGDLGRLDADGHLWITGRRNDRIVTGGVNVDATEVEDVLRGHPAVVDVCVAGIPDPEWGEVVAAWVVPVEGEFDLDEVDAWLRERVTGAKRPRRWVVESSIPLNANGKPDRGLVRTTMAGSR